MKSARRATRSAGPALLALFLLAASVPAQDPGPRPAAPAAPPKTELTMTMTLDKVGDARLVLDCAYPPQMYQVMMNRSRPYQKHDPKAPPPAPKPPDINIFLRTTTISQFWFSLDDVRGAFNDAANSVHLECTVRGASRIVRGDLWEGLLGEDRDVRSQQIAIEGSSAVITSTLQGAVGPVMMTYKVVAPPGSDGLRLLRSPMRLAYHMPVEREAGTHPAVDFRFEARPQVMTCAAKCYSDEKFPQLWVARAILKNTGDQPIRDYRVRFRLAEYASDWSEWKRCGLVVPGQTVVDAYFPLLDIDKVNRLEGRRATALKVEYEYRQADGSLVRDDDSRRVEVLGRNEQLKGCFPPDQWNSDFYTIHNYGPLTLACFVTKDDPVIREAAGMISSKIPGLDAVGWNDKSAIAFMHATYDFMQHNRIAYQLAPFLFDGHEAVQHVKYGRDVLQNRAGTCIDLAIFFGSVCEAVGLDPVLLLVPGHCYPAIRLPKSGKLFAVESTRIQREPFEAAAKEATDEELQNVFTGKTPAYVVDIMAIRRQGVGGMELPPLPGGTLEAWHYDPGAVLNDLGGVPAGPGGPGGPGGPVTPVTPTLPPAPPKVELPVGTWRGNANIGGVPVQFDVTLNANNTYQTIMTTQFGRTVDQGTFSMTDDGTFTANSLVTLSGEMAVIRWVNKDSFTYTLLLTGQQIIFNRAK